jgi:hypothetical protein
MHFRNLDSTKLQLSWSVALFLLSKGLQCTTLKCLDLVQQIILTGICGQMNSFKMHEKVVFPDGRGSGRAEGIINGNICARCI